ncbi:unnamed protein product [Tenebrio molitor]|nr:unnamed protein product [Tenebrio molitor]
MSSSLLFIIVISIKNYKLKDMKHERTMNTILLLITTAESSSDPTLSESHSSLE